MVVRVAWSYCKNPTKIAREVIKDVNNKKIVPIDSDIIKIRVYTNKANIEKLKANRDKYFEDIKKHNDEINDLKEED